MNERIQELAQLAVADAAKYCQRPFDLSREENETFAMSFAELMIQECCEVCAGIASVRAGYNDPDGRDTAYSCGDMIKEHFGIES